MHHSYSLIVSYDGTNYYGWQKTKQFPTIQGELEKACGRILQEEIRCESASRTDRGVHAAGQVVQFFTTKQRNPEALRKSLNGVLPPDIRVLQAQEIAPHFHPSVSARMKTYRYHLCFNFMQNPFDRKYSWHYPASIDIANMRQAAHLFVGEHDFGAFTTITQKNTIRSVFKIDIILVSPDRLCIQITADRFLYKMARTIAGTLTEIGAGTLSVDIIPQLFCTCDRRHAGITAPAHGLTLQKVHYSDFNPLTTKDDWCEKSMMTLQTPKKNLTQHLELRARNL